MYILTKRATDGVQTWHSVYGMTPNPSVARAWFRSTRVTDVFELVPREIHHYYGQPHGFEQSAEDIISSTKLESWREQHTREEKERAKCQTQPSA